MDLSMQRIGVIGSNAAELCTLINVDSEHNFLQQIMSPEAFQECLRAGGEANVARVQILCQIMIKQIMSGNSKIYDSLSEYFLMRSEAYKSMHQRFTAINWSSNKENSEPILPQEEVKALSEKQCGQLDAVVDSQSPLVHLPEALVDKKSDKEIEMKPHENYDVMTPSTSCHLNTATLSVSGPLPKSRLTPDEKLKFSHLLVPPMEANEAGTYPTFHCNGTSWLNQWKRVVLEGSSELCWLPPLIFTPDIVKKAAINLDIERQGNDLWIAGRFHNHVPARISNLNVKLKMNITFTKKDDTKWTVNRQLIVTVGRLGSRFFILYDFPFDSLSLSAPVFDISIKCVSPDEKWFYFGLAPRFSRDGKFESIDCSLLNGNEDCGREWKKVMKNDVCDQGFITLPPLVVATQNGEDVAVFVDGRREEGELVFDATFHPSMLKKAKACVMVVKMTLNFAKSTESAEVRMHVEKKVSVGHKVKEAIRFVDVPWTSLSSSVPPCVTISLLPVA